MPVTIARAAFAMLRRDGPAPEATIHALPADVDEYLVAHVDDLVDKADRDDAPPGTFTAPAGEATFRELAGAAPAAFARQATAAAAAVHAGMDRRTSDGLLVVLQLAGLSAPGAAVLKLDGSHGGARVRPGAQGVPLQMVHDLADQPGKLQMGAVYPDARTSSDLIVASKGQKASLYFLKAFDAQQMEKATTATTALLRSVQRVSPAAAEPIAEQLSETEPTTAAQFVEALPDDVLDPLAKQQVMVDLRRRDWPVERIAPTARTLKRTLAADGITVSGYVPDMRDVQPVEQPDGTWRITIDVSSEPTESFSL